MWLLTLKDRKSEGAYAVHDENGDKVLFMFEKKVLQIKVFMYVYKKNYFLALFTIDFGPKTLIKIYKLWVFLIQKGYKI